MTASFKSLIAELSGQEPPFSCAQIEFPHSGLGRSQLNEVLLSYGLDRVSEPFFAYLSSHKSIYESGMVIDSIESFRDAVTKFQKHALLRFGNIKHAFKKMREMDHFEIQNEIEWDAPRLNKTFTKRHQAAQPITEIPSNKTFLLGYLVNQRINDLSKNSSTKKLAKSLKREMEHYRKIGSANHNAYLVSDHMDVYVATSMREPHEFSAVFRTAKAIFGTTELKKLNPRYFDPTQAYCHDRIDKGLAEALMLKRASCTIYLAQESDTLGKDSELASTLAQGKPVIAYVPSHSKESAARELDHVLNAPQIGTALSTSETLLQHLKLINPKLAWENPQVRKWLKNPSKQSTTEIKNFVIDEMIKHYDKRARTLKIDHPLGVQVHLESGVANGVLVARTIADCAELVRRVITNCLDFELSRESIEGTKYLLLRESLTGSVFRVVSGDAVLTNAFWNHYL